LPQKRLEKWRKSSIDELRKELEEINTELMKLISVVRAGGAPENPARIRFLKKQKARLLTIIREKELGIGESKKA